MTDTVPDTTELPAWDLSDLFSSPEDPRILSSLAAIKADAEAFATRYKGKLAELTATQLAAAIAEYERLSSETTRTASYPRLRFAADTAPENGALLQKVREEATAATLPLLFFDLELRSLPAETLETLVSAPELAQYRHFLTVLKAFVPFRLSEPEERVITELANTGSRAFQRLHQELTANLRFVLPEQEKACTLSEILDLQSNADRTVRKAASEALTAGLVPHLRTYAFIYNTLVQNKATEDRLRGYSYPEEARHLSNELTRETVETVATVAESGFPLVARFYDIKKRLLQLDTLYQYDRYAPLLTTETMISYDRAREMILDAFFEFHPDYVEATRAFFNNPWIDAAPRPGKQGGAFCSYITPDHHPVLFVNYLNKPSDVRTLAHELGHGIHSYLSRGQSFLNFSGTLPMAEVASTFAEQLIFDRMIADADTETRRAAYGDQIEQSFATVFRQIMLFRFEQTVHQERRATGELSVERFAALWQEGANRMFGGAVTFEEGHGAWWTYIPHFISTPFYVYAYTFGEMLALALYQRYRQEGASFAPTYLEMLRAGGSLSPTELVAPLGIDLTDAVFWQGALTLIAEKVDRFSQLAEKYAEKSRQTCGWTEIKKSFRIIC